MLDDELSLECLRIPHFYRAFYVYKYATGLSAAIALAERVTEGGKAELDAYLRFLNGGSSKDPLDLLRDAGVDMETPEPVNAALRKFGQLVEFKMKHGHCAVPAGWSENKSLAIWVAVQRRQRKANQLSEERIKKLDSIGFIWVVGKGRRGKLKVVS